MTYHKLDSTQLISLQSVAMLLNLHLPDDRETDDRPTNQPTETQLCTRHLSLKPQFSIRCALLNRDKPNASATNNGSNTNNHLYFLYYLYSWSLCSCYVNGIKGCVVKGVVVTSWRHWRRRQRRRQTKSRYYFLGDARKPPKCSFVRRCSVDW